MIKLDEVRICVVGLGYVGLPLAVELSKAFPVVGFDINPTRVEALRLGNDVTKEVEKQSILAARNLSFTASVRGLSGCNFYIVTVPTPIDEHKKPDLKPLQSASETVGKLLKAGDIVVYESTVYPGATEEVCVPILERESGLDFNTDFVVGYSPERINPGERSRPLASIVKITSGSTEAAGRLVDDVYRQVITAGTHIAATIKIAEAAKVIENTQRDLNIALINELAIIFNKLAIDTQSVLNAAGTKWNFLPFRPGLVGGHCIGVDPYYLTHKAEAVGYHPQIILAGRRLNDGMSEYVAMQMIKAMITRDIPIRGARVLVMGLTFKENCPDLRNTKIVDLLIELAEYGVITDVYDPCAEPDEAQREYGLTLIGAPDHGVYDGIILAVAHNHFADMGAHGIRKFGRPEHVLYDLKYLFPADETDLRL